MDLEDIADFRRAVRGHLAERPTVALTPGQIMSRLRREWGNQGVDYVNACEFLTGLGHLKLVPDSLGGSNKYYQATPEGIIAHESGQ
ncbi:MAG: hypothetical protein QM680_14565 [Luteolibacter sp.]